jgi:hypothetical protein
MIKNRKTNFPELDLSMKMSKIEGKLRFLASCSEKVSEWTPSFTQAETILESLEEIQTLREEFNDFIKKSLTES